MYFALIRKPWWVSVALGFSFFLFFWKGMHFVHFPGYRTNALMQALDRILHDPSIMKAGILVSLVFFTFTTGKSIQRQRERSALFKAQRGLWNIRQMSWQDFELLVGETFRRQGYAVQETGQGGADGGVDLVLTKNGKKSLVQCKNYRSTSIGVSVVREMFGLMVHHKADEVFIVTAGNFTRKSIDFVQEKKINLIDGEKLLCMINTNPLH